MPSGGARPGAGRPKGSRNKRTEANRRRAAKDGDTPLEFLLKVMRDEGQEFTARMEAAKSAAPYCHPKLVASKIEINDESVKRLHDLFTMPDDQLQKELDELNQLRH